MLQQSCRCTPLLVQTLTAALRRFRRLLLPHHHDRSCFQSLKKKSTLKKTVRELMRELIHEQRAN